MFFGGTLEHAFLRLGGPRGLHDLAKYNEQAGRDLLPKAIRERLPRISDVVEEEDPTLHVRLFKPSGSNWEWYVTAAEPRDDDYVLWVYVTGDPEHVANEWGSVLLSELRTAHCGFCLGVERDISFEPTKFSQLLGEER